MITYVSGSLFQSPAKTLVNTVNTVGAMGTGIALEFKRIYPEMFLQYQELCRTGQLKVGTLWLYRSQNKWVLNFPTKASWKQPSKIEYIDSGLKRFVEHYAEMGIESIAFPPLGCGNGQLDFDSQVKPLIEKHLTSLPIDIFVYPDRSDGFTKPEHEDIKQVKKWLRQEPYALPFTEVWDDLLQLLAERVDFYTISKSNGFRAKISSAPQGISIDTGSKQWIVKHETLSSFWQHLRDHGLSYRNISPVDRDVSYLAPIFSELPYVKPVQVSDNFTTLRNNPSTGLQVLPLAFSKKEKFKQAALFEAS